MILSQEPRIPVSTLSELLGIALAMEKEAAHRYQILAANRQCRGDPSVAQVFQDLAEEESRHADAVGSLITDLLDRDIPDTAPYLWYLPPDIARSWEEVRDDAHLTPYKALSIAVINEMRAFSYYSYIAAHAAPAIAAHAESLAREELEHAALLRQERRKAFHRDHAAMTALPQVRTLADLRHLAAVIEAEIGSALMIYARRLMQAGRTATATAVLELVGHVPMTPDPSPPDIAASDLAATHKWVQGMIERAMDIYSDAIVHMREEEGISLAQDLLQSSVAKRLSIGNSPQNNH